MADGSDGTTEAEAAVGTDEHVRYRVAEMTWQEIEAATERTGTLLVPVGATEQHGHHLPLGVDVYMPEAIGERVARTSPALLAPPVHYGVSSHHTFKPGTFTVSTETFRRYVTELCASTADWGIEHVLLLNGHYLAQDPELEIAVRDLREGGIEAFHVPLIDLFSDVAAEIRRGETSFHAAEFETSIMLALYPELVRMDRAERVDVPAESLPLTDYDALGENRVGWALTAEEMDELTPTGNLGDPTVATAETGERLVETAVSRVRSLVEALETRE